LQPKTHCCFMYARQPHYYWLFDGELTRLKIQSLEFKISMRLQGNWQLLISCQGDV
jgi:hypothetical protein